MKTPGSLKNRGLQHKKTISTQYLLTFYMPAHPCHQFVKEEWLKWNIWKGITSEYKNLHQLKASPLENSGRRDSHKAPNHLIIHSDVQLFYLWHNLDPDTAKEPKTTFCVLDKPPTTPALYAQTGHTICDISLAAEKKHKTDSYVRYRYIKYLSFYIKYNNLLSRPAP